MQDLLEKLIVSDLKTKAMTELSWFLENIGERVYPVVNPQSHVEAKDGVFISSKKHAMRLYIEAREKGINYSNQKRWF